ncbi:MAG TPA: hypothetical protein PK514_00985 [Spirochaetota bacterium]|nr:hypothetical protein [Spirochaetota bacterium]
METDNRSAKKLRITVIILSILSAALILTPFIRTAITSHRGLVLDVNGNYFMIKKFHLCGETIICSKSSFISQKKDAALADETGTFSFSIISTQSIKYIEFIPAGEEGDENDESPDTGRLGRFKINVQGHEGTLVLYEKEEKIYGTVRFPGWANGVTEYLTGIKITGDRINFTRSATTVKEMNRLGANNLFTQKFSGTYSKSGKRINGYFVNNRREKYQWEAVK